MALVELLKTGTDDEKQHAAKTIWTLCFDDYSKEKVRLVASSGVKVRLVASS